jgi:glutamate 5-kinase
MAKMGLSQRPTETPMKQACAAVGQCELMYMYDKLFGEYNLTVAQILLTKYVVDSKDRNNVVNTFEKLISNRVIPIVNENDTVAIDELELELVRMTPLPPMWE